MGIEYCLEHINKVEVINMNRRRSILGFILILIGLSAILKNLKLMPDNSLLIFVGTFLFYLWHLNKQNLFLVLGTLGIIFGLISLLDYYGIFHLRMSTELVLLTLGIIFLYFYYSKRIFGFVFPGAILISHAIYLFLMSNFNSGKMWPSYFLLLGFAFYLIYFIAFYEKSSWPLVVGTILILLGIVFLGFSFGILSWRIYKYYNYIIPAVLILIGIILLMKVFSGKGS